MALQLATLTGTGYTATFTDAGAITVASDASCALVAAFSPNNQDFKS